jgi:hypothetical protein
MADSDKHIQHGVWGMFFGIERPVMKSHKFHAVSGLRVDSLINERVVVVGGIRLSF